MKSSLMSRLAGFLITGLLALVYVTVVVPVGMLRQAFRPDPLHRKLDRSAATYWRAP